jgi:hypothetical protein
MADIDRENQASAPVQITGADENFKADVIEEFDPASNSSNKKLHTKTTTSIRDRQGGWEMALAPSGAFEVGELIRLVGGNFESGTLLPNLCLENSSGSGSAEAVLGELVLDTATTANGFAEVQSVRRARFVTATFNKAHLGVTMPNFNAADCVREVGMFDPVQNIINGDGIFLRNNAGTVSIVQRKGGVEVAEIPETNWNGRLDPNGNRFTKTEGIFLIEIVYNAGAVFFYQNRRLLHRFGFGDSIGYETVHLPVAARIENINNNTTQNLFKVRALSCSRIGSASSIPEYYRVTNAGTVTIKKSPTNLKKLVISQLGGGAASVVIYDSATGTNNPVVEFELTKAQTDHELDIELTNGLTYQATGPGFEFLLIFD